MQLFGRTLAGETVSLDVEACETIGSIKSKLEGDTNTTLGLVFAGQCLEDDTTITECGACDGSTLHVVSKLPGGGDGTPAMGKRHKKTHIICIRCGKRSYHLQKKRCASCGYPDRKMRSYGWSKKAKRRRAPGTGRMRYVKTIARRFKNGFREGTTPTPRKKGAAAAAK
mmetsp:Transcript_89809/g.290648  ORF Transcript_89809/g.290648 Transcript_89809/m.290648 type:complete len:169 (-) Transcript_89809:131-637(-)